MPEVCHLYTGASARRLAFSGCANQPRRTTNEQKQLSEPHSQSQFAQSQLIRAYCQFRNLSNKHQIVSLEAA
ncbi:MAG: hypothetical protein CL693_04685 [Cellvibrionaceae bacterium]|nr:hypothetical protein [Cellvibrionaceae bacterium]